ncbi:R3H domain-containing protein 4-like [Oscarella lobularis]|uniref:R3H domain-containing protein 4-like n=1 Tax=Oscarella lobularis TaxID=121494 RepID=UPI0033144CE1
MEQVAMGAVITDELDSTQENTPRSRCRRRHAKSHKARPLSHAISTAGRRKVGLRSKKRVENSYYISGYVLHEEELDVDDIVPEFESSFTSLLKNPDQMETWREFLNRSEEEQVRYLRSLDERIPNNDAAAAAAEKKRLQSLHPPAAQDCFRRISRRLRSVLRSRHLPLGIIERLEEEIAWCFDSSPDGVMVCLIENSYNRLLLHAVCQYLHLCSATFVRDGVCHTEIENEKSYFFAPTKTLVDYLQT